MPNWKASFKSKLLDDRHVVKMHTTLPDYYYWQDFVAFLVVTAIVVTFLALLGYIILISEKTNSNCARFENKIVHQNAYTQWIYTGKSMIPIFHPAGDYNRRVCVEPK